MNTTGAEERKATVRKDLYRDVDGNEYIQYTIKYEDGSGEFVRVSVNTQASGVVDA